METPNVPMEFADLVKLDGADEPLVRDDDPITKFLEGEGNLSKASSGPGRVRVEVREIDGVKFQFGFNYAGDEIFCNPVEPE